jgi:hypothetical protein
MILEGKLNAIVRTDLRLYPFESPSLAARALLDPSSVDVKSNVLEGPSDLGSKGMTRKPEGNKRASSAKDSSIGANTS